VFLAPHGIARRAYTVTRDHEENRNSSPEIQKYRRQSSRSSLHVLKIGLNVERRMKGDYHEASNTSPKVQAGVTGAAGKHRSHDLIH
jgi:hypothetical protein